MRNLELLLHFIVDFVKFLFFTGGVQINQECIRVSDELAVDNVAFGLVVEEHVLLPKVVYDIYDVELLVQLLNALAI